jgi:hypothetical protein
VDAHPLGEAAAVGIAQLRGDEAGRFVVVAIEERAAGIQLVPVVGELGDDPLPAGSIASVLACLGQALLFGWFRVRRLR